MSQLAQGLAAVTRFAPSPTGPLHLGHLLSIAFVWATAKVLRAKVILRIEDHDRGRCRKSYEEQILHDLDWLGFVADQGVSSSASPSPFRQSDCLDRYAAELTQLRATNVAYPCYCSRREIALHGASAAGPSPQPGAKIPLHGANEETAYPGTCRGREVINANHGWRWKMPASEVGFADLWCGAQLQVPAQQCGDLLLQERSGSYTYQFCVTSDDIAQGVNLIVRGQDLLSSAGRQLHLRRALMSSRDNLWDPKLLHHPLIADPSGRKLSKKDLDRSLTDYRQEGFTPQALLRAAFSQIPGLERANNFAAFCDLVAQKINPESL